MVLLLCKIPSGMTLQTFPLLLYPQGIFLLPREFVHEDLSKIEFEVYNLLFGILIMLLIHLAHILHCNTF